MREEVNNIRPLLLSIHRHSDPCLSAYGLHFSFFFFLFLSDVHSRKISTCDLFLERPLLSLLTPSGSSPRLTFAWSNCPRSLPVVTSIICYPSAFHYVGSYGIILRGISVSLFLRIALHVSLRERNRARVASIPISDYPYRCNSFPLSSVSDGEKRRNHDLEEDRESFTREKSLSSEYRCNRARVGDVVNTSQGKLGTPSKWTQNLVQSSAGRI